MNRKGCGNFDADSCLEYGSPGVIEDCASAGKICENGACVRDSSKKASVGLSFSDIVYSYSGGYHYYNHKRTFSETGGVGVTFTSGEACYQSTGQCDSGSVYHRVEANGQYSFNTYFYTNLASEVFIITYDGVDDNGNVVTVSQSKSVSGSSY